MKHITTFNSFKINEIQDMFSLPIDVVEQTGKDLDKIKPYFNDLIEDLKAHAEESSDLGMEDFLNLKEFCKVCFGGIEPELNFATIKRMALELNKQYHTIMNENSQSQDDDDNDDDDDDDTDFLKKFRFEGEEAQKLKSSLRDRLKGRGFSDKEIYDDFPSLRKAEIKKGFGNFVKRLFSKLMPKRIVIRLDLVITVLIAMFSKYLSLTTGKGFIGIFFTQIGILLYSVVLAILIVVIYQDLKKKFAKK